LLSSCELSSTLYFCYHLYQITINNNNVEFIHNDEYIFRTEEKNPIVEFGLPAPPTDEECELCLDQKNNDQFKYQNIWP
jgi:hypothetical protein